MEITDKFTIYNKDCRYLNEVADRTVDLVITSPPFNISHRYRTYHDSLDYKDFEDLYSTVIRSISRVLKDDGFFIVDIADIIVMESNIVYGAEFVKEMALDANLLFIQSYPYIAIEGADVKMNSCISRNDKEKKFHSSCEQILIFGKKQAKRELIKNLNIKSTYIYSVQHDSAFWPELLIKNLLAPFTLKDKVLMDPFMGSGTIARMAIQQGVFFIGYDIDEETLRNYNWI
jgi:DNA modification methylase